jgi:hypothetical protein
MAKVVCGYIWTTNNGVYFHHCDLPPGHGGPHSCDLEFCEWHISASGPDASMSSKRIGFPSATDTN